MYNMKDKKDNKETQMESKFLGFHFVVVDRLLHYTYDRIRKKLKGKNRNLDLIEMQAEDELIIAILINSTFI